MGVATGVARGIMVFNFWTQKVPTVQFQTSEMFL